MKWHKFSEDRESADGGYHIRNMQSSIMAVFKGIHLIAYENNKYLPCLCTIDENNFISTDIQKPGGEIFFLIMIAKANEPHERPYRKGFDPYDIVTNGEKIRYVENLDGPRCSDVYAAGNRCMVTDKVPPQAIVLTAAHRHAIMKLGKILLS